jgi:hypothetical protein
MKANQTSVEVFQPWCATPSGPEYAWKKGYVFVESLGKTTTVRVTDGLFKGLEVRYPSCDIRAV